jgi:hypothetical protein
MSFVTSERTTLPYCARFDGAYVPIKDQMYADSRGGDDRTGGEFIDFVKLEIRTEKSRHDAPEERTSFT